MADYNTNFMNAMNGFTGMADDTGGGNPPTGGVPPTGPGVEAKATAYAGLPSDILKIHDTRTTNPATGQPFSKKGGKDVNANMGTLSAIVAHAKAKGVDPYTALAIAMQETEFGRLDENLGSAWEYDSDPGIKDSLNQNASKLANALKEKLAYAKQLGFDKKGEDFQLQSYNGYGKLKPTVSIGGKLQPMNYYGIKVTGENPLDMRKNPVYGKTIISLRDQILKKNPAIKKLVDATRAYSAT